MLLYELDSPVEVKYGGSLTEEEYSRCTRQTELNSPRWAPYPQRSPLVENICGKFVVCVTDNGNKPEIESENSELARENADTETQSISDSDAEVTVRGAVRLPPAHTTHLYTSCLNNRQVTLDSRLDSVCFKTHSPFGPQHEMFHMDGHVTARCTPGLPRSLIFKGAKGFLSVTRLMRDMFLDHVNTIPLVHMAVISSCMGVRLQTSQCCYLENRVIDGSGTMHGGWMTVEARSPDQCNIVRLSVKDWTGLLLPSAMPLTNDIVITGKGSVVHRFTWIGLAWNEQVEHDILGACESVVEAIASVC